MGPSLRNCSFKQINNIYTHIQLIYLCVYLFAPSRGQPLCFSLGIINAPSSIVFYLEMKVEVEVGVHDIRSRFTPRFSPKENIGYHLKKKKKRSLFLNVFKELKKLLLLHIVLNTRVYGENPPGENQVRGHQRENSHPVYIYMHQAAEDNFTDFSLCINIILLLSRKILIRI